MLKSRFRCVLLCFIVGIIVAFALSSFLSVIDTGINANDNALAKNRRKHHDATPAAGDTLNNIFWIVQMTDIHISLYRDLARGPDLERFCEEYLRVIQPELVIISGDLTDAKLANGIESMQIRNEWVLYDNVIRRCGFHTKAKWLDLRGNHDSFDVYDFNSENNYYRLHSAHGEEAKANPDIWSAYLHTLRMPFGVYSFIGIDASLRPGPNRPFNFFGHLDYKQIQYLKNLASQSSGSNQTVWFGHFPTSLIVHDPPVLRQVMSQGVAYLCGHLHTLSSYVPQMYSRHKTGLLELELGDWKDNRIFRIMAFDNDLLSFTDAKLGDWPLIIITNPKNSQFLSPQKEPVERIFSSTHIRILIFSHVKITMVRIYIDRHFEGYAHQVAPGKPLYVLQWEPRHYARNIHRIHVQVTDSFGKNTSVTERFSVDGTETGFSLLPRLILMLNIFSVGKVVFGLLLFFYALILTSLRQCTYIRHCFIHGDGFMFSIFNGWIMKIWLAARTNTSYYILIGSVLYLTFGPWFVGNLLSDSTGIVFVWGIIIDKSFIPGGLTYFYGVFQFLSFTVPLTLILGHLLDTRRRHGNRMSFCHKFFIFMPAALLELFLVFLALTEFPRAYGQQALVLGPLRTGSVILLPTALLLGFRADLKQVLAINGPV